MLERTPDEVLPMPRAPKIAAMATCACCGARFARDDNDLCLGCQEASSGQGTPGPQIPLTFGQRAVPGAIVLVVSALAILRVVLVLAQ